MPRKTAPRRGQSLIAKSGAGGPLIPKFRQPEHIQIVGGRRQRWPLLGRGGRLVLRQGSNLVMRTIR